MERGWGIEGVPLYQGLWGGGDDAVATITVTTLIAKNKKLRGSAITRPVLCSASFEIAIALTACKMTADKESVKF